MLYSLNKVLKFWQGFILFNFIDYYFILKSTMNNINLSWQKPTFTNLKLRTLGRIPTYSLKRIRTLMFEFASNYLCFFFKFCHKKEICFNCVWRIFLYCQGVLIEMWRTQPTYSLHSKGTELVFFKLPYTKCCICAFICAPPPTHTHRIIYKYVICYWSILVT